MLFREQAHESVLRVVRILIFVYHQILKPVLVVFEHVRTGAEQLHGLADQVVEIHRVRVAQALLVDLVGAGDDLHAEIIARRFYILLRRDKRILRTGDLVQHSLGRHVFLGNVQLLQDIFHQSALVVGVVDCKVRGIAEALAVPAQNTRAGRVKGRRPDVVALGAEHRAKAVLELPGRLICKGDRHDFPRQAGRNAQVTACLLRQRLAAVEIGAARREIFLVQLVLNERAVVSVSVAQDVRNAVDQHSRLSASGSGKDQQRPADRKDSLPLPVVHAGEFFFEHRAAKRENFRFIHKVKTAFLFRSLSILQ